MRFWKIVGQIVGLVLFVACFATRSSAQCSVNATPVNAIFGTQAVTSPSTPGAAQTVTFVANPYDESCFSGSTTVTLQSFTITGTNAGDFAVTGGGGTPCSNGLTQTVPASCTAEVTFAPTAAGTRTATLTFTYCGSFNSCGSSGLVMVNLIGGDEVVYVTTQGGGQVVRVDGTGTGVTGTGSNVLGAVQVASGNPGTGGFSPEGITVGPDGRLYIADPNNGGIWRMNQDGTQPEMVYAEKATGGPGPPQGPSFSSSSTGDLYFNTKGSDFLKGTFVIKGVATTPFDSSFNAPTPIAPAQDSCSGTCFSPTAGAGTAFDTADNFLFVEQASASNPDSVLSVSPPYTPTDTPSTVVSGFTNPVGIALNKATGQMFVSDANTSTPQILAITVVNNVVTALPYYTFTTSTSCEFGTFGSDLPQYMQFDGAGRLFVVTTTNATNGCGKLWRIDPGDSPTATLVLNMDPAVLATIYGLNSTDQLIGLALQTSGTQSQPQSPAGGVSPTGGSFTFGWPVRCIPAVDGSAGTCSITYGLTYGNGMFQPGDIVKAILTETSQADWGKRTTGNGFAPSHLAEVLGYGGDGFIISVSCTTSANAPCTFPANNYYTTTSAWKSPDAVASWCTFGTGKNNPQLLKTDPIGSDNWIGILIGCEDKGPIHIGGSGPSLSDHANVKGATGTAPTITITTPANGANYNQNSIVDANYSCSPTPPVIAGDCFGGPDLVHGTTTVQNGSPIDTSTLGLHSFQVAADVNSGPGGSVPVIPPPEGSPTFSSQ